MIARTAARASTAMLQDKQLKNPAWPAARGSTGWEEEERREEREEESILIIIRKKNIEIIIKKSHDFIP